VQYIIYSYFFDLARSIQRLARPIDALACFQLFNGGRVTLRWSIAQQKTPGRHRSGALFQDDLIKRP
jgi:hypothetical protein